MEARIRAVLAGFGSLMIVGMAGASFEGLKAVKIEGLEPAGFEVWHVQAWFNAPGQAVQTVWGTSDPLDWVDWTTGELVTGQGVTLATNYGAGTKVHVSDGFGSPFIFPFPSAIWNVLGNYGTVFTHSPGAHAIPGIGVPAVNPCTCVGGAFSAGDFQMDFSKSYVLDDHAWARLPGDVNLNTAFDLAIGKWVQTLAQITISEGGFAEGWWNVTIFDVLAGETANIGNIYWAIPSPSALALLGVAALFGIQRRRA